MQQAPCPLISSCRVDTGAGSLGSLPRPPHFIGEGWCGSPRGVGSGEARPRPRSTVSSLRGHASIPGSRCPWRVGQKELIPDSPPHGVLRVSSENKVTAASGLLGSQSSFHFNPHCSLWAGGGRNYPPLQRCPQAPPKSRDQSSSPDPKCGPTCGSTGPTGHVTAPGPCPPHSSASEGGDVPAAPSCSPDSTSRSSVTLDNDLFEPQFHHL